MYSLTYAEIEATIEGKTCRTCKYRERWECGSKVFSYCKIHHSKRTSNGLKKVKCKDKACWQYEEHK